MVANCIASPEAAEHIFFGLLRKNGIAVNALSDGAPTTYAALDRLAKKSEAPADKDDLFRTGDKVPEAKRSLGEIAKAKDQSRDVAVFYVEGTGEQIHDLVSDLRAEPEVFRSLSVAPAPTQAVATFAYKGAGGNARDDRPIELQFGEALAGSKPAAIDAELHESLREREAFITTPKSGTSPRKPASAPTGKEPSDRLPSDQKSVEELGSKLATSDKTMKDQLNQQEPANAALVDKPTAVAGKPIKPAENGAPNDVSAQFRSLAPQRPVGEKTLPMLGTISRTPAGQAAAPSAPAGRALDAVSPSQLPAAPAAITDSDNRPLSRGDADKKSTDWREKQIRAVGAVRLRRSPRLLGPRLTAGAT